MHAGSQDEDESRSISIAEFSGQQHMAPRHTPSSVAAPSADSPPDSSPLPRRRRRGSGAHGGRPRAKRRGCVFVDDQADADGDEEDDEEEELGSEDGVPAGFVVSTQAMLAEGRTPVTDERAMYMRSLHTPESSGGRCLVQRMRGRRRL